MTVLKSDQLIDNRVSAIYQYHKSTGVGRAQLDVSGGIDSAVMAGLLVLALGADNVTLSHTIINSNPKQTHQAKALADAIGCPIAVGEFTKCYELILAELVRSLEEAGFDKSHIESTIEKDPTITGSIRSTLRAPLGRGYNRLTQGGIRHGTGNECEDRFLRFYQKGGDGEVDTNPIAMLSKTEVFQLAFALSEKMNAKSGFAPIIDAMPTPDLWAEGDNHNDEDELLTWTGAPFSYGRIDTTSGAVLRFGTIEMVSRFIDNHEPAKRLFDDALPKDGLQQIVQLALSQKGSFPDVPSNDIKLLIERAKWAEKITRHKLNPAIPEFGSRNDLVEQGIVSQTLTA